MVEETKIVSEDKTRRSAIKTAAKVGLAAPAVALLLNASAKSAMAAQVYQQLPPPPP